MREGTAPLIRREAYTPPAYRIPAVELVFDLDPARTVVLSRLTVERDAAAAPQPLRLVGEGLSLARVLANGQSVSFRVDKDEGGREELVIEQPPEGRFVLEIKVGLAPEKNTALLGLYTSGGGFFTQCEAEGFRRISYFLDRPDVMSVYTVTLRAEKARYPVLLANGNLVSQRALDGGRHEAVWHDPHPKPSYLFALVAADLVAREQRIRSRAGSEHLLQVWVRAGDLDKTEHAMRSLMASVAWDEARFGLPLDLERFMIVAVSDFNMGAMENKGLNIFNSKFVLASPATATDIDYDGIESVVAHEYFHNWTGNRVTCRDWFQLSLKEGLTVFRDQQFSMDMAGSPSARAVRRIEDVRGLRQMQFPEDAGPMAHPVRPDAYQAIDNFYTATVYEKGAEVVRMMHTLVGEAGFRAGMDRYFQRHDGQAVTCDDFAQAIADANPGSVLAGQLDTFKRWYAQAGTPRLEARGHWEAEAGAWTLSLRQHGLPSPGQPEKQPWLLPVRLGLLDAAGQALPLVLEGEDPAQAARERVLVLDRAEAQFRFVGLPAGAAAPVPSLLRGFSAPVLLDDGLDAAQRLLLLRHDPDAFNRWEAGQQLMQAELLARVRDAGPASAPLSAGLVQALGAVLRDAELSPAFRALALGLPSEGLLADALAAEGTPLDPQRVHAVRESARQQLAAELAADWAEAFEAHPDRGGYRPDAESMGRRALANLALAMLCLDATRRGDPVWPGRAYQRVKDGRHMSERFGALTALVHAQAELAGPALERFHALFRDEALVIDKWFALQAAAPEPLGAQAGSVFQRARTLCLHPDFTLKNPNRARSLLFNLTVHNPAAFHRSDAAGYVLWAEKLLEIDTFNPKLAARFARAMDRWRILAEPYRSAAHEALQRVAARPDLSGDLREILDRALAD